MADDDTVVLPKSAIDDALDTVRTGADEYEDEMFEAGVVVGAEQMHHFLTALDASHDDR